MPCQLQSWDFRHDRERACRDDAARCDVPFESATTMRLPLATRRLCVGVCSLGDFGCAQEHGRPCVDAEPQPGRWLGVSADWIRLWSGDHRTRHRALSHAIRLSPLDHRAVRRFGARACALLSGQARRSFAVGARAVRRSDPDCPPGTSHRCCQRGASPEVADAGERLPQRSSGSIRRSGYRVSTDYLGPYQPAEF